MKQRCSWCGSDPIYDNYHDAEWGVPVHDDQMLFEFLILEGAQAGLSWMTVLRKREGYREAFDGFDPRKVAKYDDRKVQEHILNPGIIRNRLKIQSSIKNASAFMDVQDEFGSFDHYIWRFVEGKPIQNNWQTVEEIPAKTAEAEILSRDLKNRGFSFVGPTICYAHMQATGMVNDHLVSCFRHKELVDYGRSD